MRITTQFIRFAAALAAACTCSLALASGALVVDFMPYTTHQYNAVYGHLPLDEELNEIVSMRHQLKTSLQARLVKSIPRKLPPGTTVYVVGHSEQGMLKMPRTNAAQLSAVADTCFVRQLNCVFLVCDAKPYVGKHPAVCGVIYLDEIPNYVESIARKLSTMRSAASKTSDDLAQVSQLLRETDELLSQRTVLQRLCAAGLRSCSGMARFGQLEAYELARARRVTQSALSHFHSARRATRFRNRAAVAVAAGLAVVWWTSEPSDHQVPEIRMADPIIDDDVVDGLAVESTEADADSSIGDEWRGGASLPIDRKSRARAGLAASEANVLPIRPASAVDMWRKGLSTEALRRSRRGAAVDGARTYVEEGDEDGR